jgi:hypothetical protein
MPREEIRLDTTLEELDAWTNALRRPSRRAVSGCNLNPITPEQLLEHIRELERKTGEKMIFRRGECPEPAA